MAIALYARKSVERENSISCETQLEYCKAMLKPEERKGRTTRYLRDRRIRRIMLIRKLIRAF